MKTVFEEKILRHLEDNYCVVIGHPSDKDGASTNLVYYDIYTKKGGKSRGDTDAIKWATRFLKEIGEKYSTESFISINKMTNIFIHNLCRKATA